MEEEATYLLSFEEGAPIDDYPNANTKVLKVPDMIEGEARIIKQNFHLGKGGIIWDAVRRSHLVLHNDPGPKQIILPKHETNLRGKWPQWK